MAKKNFRNTTKLFNNDGTLNKSNANAILKQYDYNNLLTLGISSHQASQYTKFRSDYFKYGEKSSGQQALKELQKLGILRTKQNKYGHTTSYNVLKKWRSKKQLNYFKKQIKKWNNENKYGNSLVARMKSELEEYGIIFPLLEIAQKGYDLKYQLADSYPELFDVILEHKLFSNPKAFNESADRLLKQLTKEKKSGKKVELF